MVVSFLKSVENYALQVSGQRHTQSKTLKCRKSTLKNKNFEKTKKVPRDLVETFPKRVHNTKSKKNAPYRSPDGRADVRTDGTFGSHTEKHKERKR